MRKKIKVIILCVCVLATATSRAQHSSTDLWIGATQSTLTGLANAVTGSTDSTYSGNTSVNMCSYSSIKIAGWIPTTWCGSSNDLVIHLTFTPTGGGSPTTITESGHNTGNACTWRAGVNFSTGANGFTGMPNPFTAGTIAIYITHNSFPGVSSNTLTINLTAMPSTPTITYGSDVCVGANVTFTGSPSGGTWASDYTPAATVNATTGVVHGISANTVSIQYSVADGACSNGVGRYTYIRAIPSVASITGTTNICYASATTTQLADATSGGTWSPSSGSISVNSTGLVTATSAGGPTTISYTTAANAYGCTNTANASVTFFSALADITVKDNRSTNICIGSTITLLDATTGGTWSSNNSNVSVSSGGVVTANAVGSSTITYTVSGNPCPAKTIVVTVVLCPCDETCSWVLSGNNTATSSNYIGTNTATDFVMKANASEKIRLTSDGKIKLTGLAAPPSAMPAVVIGPDGTLYQSTASGGVFSRTAGNTIVSISQKEFDDLKAELADLRVQMKAILEARNYSPCAVAQPNNNTLEIVPTPFADNAKAIYSLDDFSGEALLQVTDINGKMLKTFPIRQAKGQVDIGMINSSTTTVVFTIVSNGKIAITKKSIKKAD